MSENKPLTKDEWAYEIATKVIEAIHPIYLPEKEEIYVPIEGKLEPFGDSEIRALIEELARTDNTTSFFNTAIHHIKGRTKRKLDEFVQPSQFINVKNGYVDVDTGELNENREGKRLFLEQFPIKYDPDARCPNFLKAFKEIVPDARSRFEILRSWSVCFDKRPLKRESELWIGQKDTGKTTLLNVLRVLLGQKNYSSMTLYQLTDSSDRFSTSNLHNKSANIFDDLTAIELKEIGQYKAITGGGTIPAQFKGRPLFDFAPYCKFWFACNSPPVLLDDIILDDMAFFERFKIRFFTENFSRDAQDSSLTDLVHPEESKLCNQEEISGLFNILIGILRSVRKFNDYGYALDAETTKAQWLNTMSSSDSVSKFLNEKVIVKDGAFVSLSELKEAWEAWRIRNRVSPVSPTAFNERVEKIGYQSNNHKVRIWRGFTLKDSTNETLETLTGLTTFLSQSRVEGDMYRRYRKKPVIPVIPFASWFANPLRLEYPICQKQDCIMKGRKFDTQTAFAEHERLIHNGGLSVNKGVIQS